MIRKKWQRQTERQTEKTQGMNITFKHQYIDLQFAELEWELIEKNTQNELVSPFTYTL